MRGLGLLEYSDDLEKIIDNKEEIEENSEYEVEINALSQSNRKKIAKKLNNHICSIDINDYIWSQSKNKDIVLKPYHLTRTTNY